MPAVRILAIDSDLRHWRQGDVCLDAGLDFVHLADLRIPGTDAAIEAAKQQREQGDDLPFEPVSLLASVPGLVVLTQTCDIVRPAPQRPYLEVSPLIAVTEVFLNEVRRLQRPAFAYVPAIAQHRLVADLDRVMTVEKSLATKWQRVPGWNTDEEGRAFADALARKRSRVAFPNDFVASIQKFQRHLRKRHNGRHAEGAHLRALREIRVRAAPDWNNAQVNLGFWFVKEEEPADVTADWPARVEAWMHMFDQSGRFVVEFALACRLEDITAQDYVESDRLDLDALSSS